MRTVLKTLQFTTIVAALCLSQAAAAAGSLPRYGVFVFSNLCVSPMSDDVGGNRVTLSRFGDGDTLVYEYTDGGTHALVARSFTIDARSGTLQFAVEAETGSTSTVSGTIARDGQSITLHGLPFQGDARQTLPRVTNFAAGVTACQARHSSR